MKERKLKKFTAGTADSADAFEQKSGYQDDWIFRHNKELKIGEAIAFRFLNNDPDFNPVTEMVCASVYDTKNKRMMEKCPIPRPDLDLLGDDELLDDDGNDIRDLMENNKNYRTVQRTPIWLMYKLDKNRKVIEEYNKLVYIEINYSLSKSYTSMKEDVDSDSAFEGAMPPYAVLLCKEEGNSTEFTKYEFKPCRKIKLNGKTVDEESFGEANAEIALGEEIWAQIVEKIDDLMDWLYDLCEEEVKPENIKRRLARYRNNSSDSGGKNSEVGSMDDEEEEESEEEQEQEEEEEKPKRRRGRGNWSK